MLCNIRSALPTTTALPTTHRFSNASRSVCIGMVSLFILTIISYTSEIALFMEELASVEVSHLSGNLADWKGVNISSEQEARIFEIKLLPNILLAGLPQIAHRLLEMLFINTFLRSRCPLFSGRSVWTPLVLMSLDLFLSNSGWALSSKDTLFVDVQQEPLACKASFVGVWQG